MGTYLHGLFAADPFRRAFLGEVAQPDLDYEARVDTTLDALADHLEHHLDVPALFALAREV
jgi:adenosylcobyric acid synthase